MKKWILVAVCVTFLSLFLLWPLAGVGKGAFYAAPAPDQPAVWTVSYFKRLLLDPTQRELVLNSLAVAAGTTVLTLFLALPLAWVFARRSFFGKSVLVGLLLIPMILPPFVGAVGLMGMLSRTGPLSLLCMRLGLASEPVDWLGSWPIAGVIFMEALHLLPILYLNLVAAFANVDPSLEEAALNLGASPARVFRRVTLPLAMPGLFAGLILVFVWSFTELGTPLVFGYREVLPVQVYDAAAQVHTSPVGHAQVVLMLVVTALGFGLTKWWTRKHGTVATLGRMSRESIETPLSTGGTLAVYAFFLVLISVSLLPHISVAGLSFFERWFMTVLPEEATLKHFHSVMGMELTRTALVNSLFLAVSAVILDLFLGFSIAWLCVRSRVRGSLLLDGLAMLPLAVPGLVVAFGYLDCFGGISAGEHGPFLRSCLVYLDPRQNPMLLLAAGYAVRRLPFMVRAAHAGLEQVSVTYEEAAANMGASPWRIVWRITMPLVSANLLAGGILCFAFSMLEVSESLILAQSDVFYPVTKAIYALINSLENGINLASALGMWAMLLLAAAMVWAGALMGKRIGQMFRV